MSYGKKLARSFVNRLTGFNTTMDGAKRTDGPVLRGYHCPGSKPGSYHSANTIPENSRKYGNGQCKGVPSKVMERLRNLAKSKGQVWKFGV